MLPAGYDTSVAFTPRNFNAYLNFQHVTKAAEHVGQAANAPAALRRAFTQVRNGRPGPVLVELPHDVLAQPLPADAAYEPAPVTRSAPDPAAVDVAAAALVAADRPVVYAGQGVHYAKAWPELLALAELLEAAVTTSLGGKSAFPETHPLSLGTGGRTYPKPVIDFLWDCDVLFGVGCSFSATPFGVPFPSDKTVIHSTLDPGDLNKDLPVRHALVGDAKLTLAMLIEAVRERLVVRRADGARRSPPRSRAAGRRGCRTGARSSTTTRAR